jgi:hypothetical protein
MGCGGALARPAFSKFALGQFLHCRPLSLQKLGRPTGNQQLTASEFLSRATTRRVVGRLNGNRSPAGRPQLAQLPGAVADLTRVVDLHFEYREHAVQFGESTNRVLEGDCAPIDA